MKFSLKKLEHYGIRGTAQKWFHSYLSNRDQFVLYGKQNSNIEKIKCGVPQGSILGPLLFIIYINDIYKSSLRGNFILFADDTNVLYHGSNLKEVEKITNEELEKIQNWLNSNKLFLNVNKTKFLLFHPKLSNEDTKIDISINQSKIERVHDIKFLGVHLDDKLNWKQHINEKAKQISKTTGVLNKIKHTLPKHICKTIYNT